ncbi:Uma2 family endonuclease [Phormidium sp. FACHB-592]|uniref:Uma2 family endonuclease n=1 Tax=Stenomitos frigidus AS-A4 TaxID=2933935 RepID=A0ABV0KIF1_9CYAN|nr:Uma2 family endonuclease [Phormidium sp. FACHB-592]MBD2075710.1 Uma2 family endonuclease [Phormidium sp. FACHB-592]
MTQALPQLMNLDEFLDWYPNGEGRYELIDGLIVEMQPTGQHSEVSGFIDARFSVEIECLKLPYFIPRDCVVKPIDTNRSGYQPDVIVLDETTIDDDPLWEPRSTITQGRSVRLIVEVVSTNWRDDYLKKLADYEALGIPEYWVVDYAALGASRYTGQPKQPTLSLFTLVDGEYQVSQFHQSDPILSPTFPEIHLTAEQVFTASRPAPTN